MVTDKEGRASEPAFKVRDRRRFTASGEPREGTEPAEGQTREPGGAQDPEAAGVEHARESPGAGATQPSTAPEGISFAAFVLGLSTEALAHLGEIPHPVDKAVRTDLTAARQVIDILGMLRQKTEGNLSPEERSLLDHILYDLRMKYVERVRRS